MKRVLLFSLILLLVTDDNLMAQTTATPPNGSGTSGAPYLISNLAELSYVCQNLGVTDYWASGVYLKQTANIDASQTQYWDDTDDDSNGDKFNDTNDGTATGNNEGFSPIGNSSTKFQGNYDGNDKTISNLFIDRGTTDHVGFFGYLLLATVTDLTLTSVDITGQYRTGALTGIAEGNTTTATVITNCSASGSISGTLCVGGLLGQTFYKTNITNSHSSVNVTASNDYTGGFTGGTWGTTSAYTATFTNCSSTGTVTSSSNITGGFIGQVNGGKFYRCYASGNVIGSSNANVGGFAGVLGNDVTSYVFDIIDCYSTGDVTAATTDWHAGGFIAYIYDDGNTISIDNCYSTGTITAGSLGSTHKGGFIGEVENTSSYGTITDCFWDTETSGFTAGIGNVSSPSGLTGKTTLQMQTQSTFTNWDFAGETSNGNDNYWRINPENNSVYPFLSWQGYSHYSVVPSGDGSSGSPYQIATLNNLFWLSQYSSEWASGTYFTQTANIDASATSAWYDGEGFLPFGNSSTKFMGSYDGNSNTISSLTIDRSSTDNVGLFGYIELATITDLTLTSVDITGNNYVGALTGNADGNTTTAIVITNCSSSGSVSGAAAVGGLIGITRYKATITNSHSSVNVTASNAYSGGFIGGTWNTTSTYTATFTNCSATGTVTSSNDRVGGFIGLVLGGKFYQCYASGNVSCSSSNTNVGGFAGVLGSDPDPYVYDIIDCYSTGDVTAASTTWQAGGFIAFIYDDGSTIAIDNCYSTGVVSGGSTASKGGFIGRVESSSNHGITDSFWDTETSGFSNGIGLIENPSGLTGKTTVEMKTVATFTDETTTGLTTAWDFETNPNDDVANNDYWDMDLSGVTNSGYPFLSWQNGEDTSLPVELASFVVTETRSDAITLEWITESEIENIGFILERRDVLGEDHTEWIELSSYLTEPRLQGQGSVTHRTIYTYRDETVEPGKVYDYRLADVSYSGEKTYHSVTVLGIEVTPVPEKFTLYPVYPNPFNPVTTIEYELVEAGIVTLAVYDIMGRELMTLVNEHQSSGLHTMLLDGNSLSSGEYLLQLTQNDQVTTQKLILLK